MHEAIILKAAAQFGTGDIIYSSIGNGLIHRTYEVLYKNDNRRIILQCINQKTFPLPENIIRNYTLIYTHLRDSAEKLCLIPKPLNTNSDRTFWIDEQDNFWRATEYIHNSFSPSSIQDSISAFNAARCFGLFTRSMSGLDHEKLNIIIPGFHDLSKRYHSFEEAVKKAHINRLLKSTHLIAEIRQRRYLVEFYNGLANNPGYILRIMHHDCKISNILFDIDSKKAVCPVDIDTTMPGYFFSDLGDMIRTMACTENEDSVAWEKIDVDKEIYRNIVAGYREGTGDIFTKEENDHLHYSGLLLVYMQLIRFLTDFLNNDIYYHTTYPEQNLNRALNQFILLEKLEEIN